MTTVLLTITGLIKPRITFILIYCLTDWLNVFATYIYPFIGFLIMPTSALCYMYIMHNGDFNFMHSMLFLLAMIIDFGNIYFLVTKK